MNEKKLKITVVIGIFFGFFIIYAILSSYLYSIRKETFKLKVEDTLSIYGSQIEDVYVDGMYVGVYVDGERYNKASKSVQEAWQKEVVSLIRMDAISTEIIKHGQIMVAFHTDKSLSKSVGQYIIKE